MDASEVKRIAEAALEPMATALHVREYEVHLRFEPLDDGNPARCEPNCPYLYAVITLDPAQQDDEEQVLNDLRHELLHVVHAEWAVYDNMLKASAGEWLSEEVADRAYTLASERQVAKLERMLDGLGMTAERLANWNGVSDA